MADASTAKRRGRPDSATGHALLDATERVLRAEGYGAATSRRVAQEAGVKQQLLFYYFDSMDEMLLAAFQRRTQRGLARLQQDLASARPLRALWEDYSRAVDPKLTFEYMALANHHAGIRREVATFIRRTRRLQAERIAAVYRARGMSEAPVSPAAAAFLIGCVSLLLGREAGSGINTGHREVRRLVQWCLKQVE